MEKRLKIERYLRGIAGLFLIISVILTYFHSLYWILSILFIALNLAQSAISKWCPMMLILDKIIKE